MIAWQPVVPSCGGYGRHPPFLVLGSIERAVMDSNGPQP